MNRRLVWAVSGVVSCAAAVLVTTLLSSSDEPVGAQIVVPLEQDSGPVPQKPPSSSVSVLFPAPPVAPAPSTPAPAPATSEPRKPPAPLPKPVVTTPHKFGGVDLQAENARIHNGEIDSEHAGFTGSGFVNYDNVTGSSVEWTVTAPTTTGTDVVFRFANGSPEARPMDITVNGILIRSVVFPRTNGWTDWRTVTVHVNLLAGTNTIKATATTGNGGPNVDKIILM